MPHVMQVVLLDEPSTGLDPASRRLLWKCITTAKPTRAILLTTHSMQEAEGFADIVRRHGWERLGRVALLWFLGGNGPAD